MTVRLSTLVLLALVTLALGLASSDEVNKYELDEDSTTKGNFDISFVVNRKFAKPDDDVEYDEDEEDEEDDEDEEDLYQSGEFEEDLTPEERESLKKEPYRRLSNWNQRGGWPQHPLYVIILGGFRWDFLKTHENDLKAFDFLRKHGVTMPYVRPVFPTEDYPVWTSIATGRYPEDHGIVGDFMYDLKNQRLFNSSDYQTTRMAEWWKDATPFWSTAAKHGNKMAFYNWHDCQLPGAALENPQDCRPYEPAMNHAAPSKSKIAREFDEAFTKLYHQKYQYLMTVVYTDLIRRVSELHGPDSSELVRALRDIDDVLQAKLTDVRAKEERQGLKMNVLVLSDYGMTDTSKTTEVSLDHYIDLDDIQYIMYSSGYASIVPYALRHEKIIHALAEMPGVDVYLAKQVQDPPIFGGVIIPEKLKYGRGANTQDILIVAKPSFRIVSDNGATVDKVINVQELNDDILKVGTGYNPVPTEIFYPHIDKRTIITKKINDTIRDYHLYHEFKSDMLTQAFAYGPDFKKNYVHDQPIEAVDFYQLLCFLMQIPTEENDGDWSRIEPMLTISSATSQISSIVMIMLWSIVSGILV